MNYKRFGSIMLSTVTQIGRSKILLPCTLTVVNTKLGCLRSQSLFRGYVKKYSNSKHSKLIDNKVCHTTKVQYYSTESYIASTQELDAVQYEKVANDTLESLTEYFDELVEKTEHLNEADVTYGDGVLTVKFGNIYGTYVINRQTPNKQIWLSSPISGPKRYDFVHDSWIYKHDGKSLHELLDTEIPSIVKDKTSFSKCAYSKKPQ